ncbi:glycosyltransferase [Synechococcus lacustris]|uniref:glycosyltransferase n=1 Tax=Synechococcus lacustris TaxID=2116544 RepID=UPI003342ACAB
MIPIFIGYDSRETVGYHVLAHSLLARSSQPLAITPIALNNLAAIFKRPRDPLQSTDFSFSRFLVPHLSNYQGWSIFMDGDMLCQGDIAELWNLRDDRYAMMCIQHDYTSKETTKFLGEKQTSYHRKNWSSLMLFNNARCQKLTPHAVETESGLWLHQFHWLEDQEIGAIPATWNHLVGVYPKAPTTPKLIHYTLGGPHFNECRDCDYAPEWFTELEHATFSAQKETV